MRTHTVRTLTLLLAIFGAAPLHAADTLNENFDDGSIDARFLVIQPPGFTVAVAAQKLEMTKAAGTGNGDALVRSGVLSGDFTAAARVERADLAGSAELGLRAVFQGGAVAEIYFSGTDALKAAIDGPATTNIENAALATLRIRRDSNSIFCEIDTGTGFDAKNSAVSVPLGKAKARIELFLRQATGSTLAHTGRFDDLAVVAAVIQGGGGGGPTPTPTGAVGPTPTPRSTPPTLDHFTSYGVKVTKGTPPFFALGPVTLLAGNRYDVLKVGALLLPANKNAEGVHDEATHLLEYRIKPGKDVPKFAALADVRVLNQCNDLFVQLSKPVSLLVPTAKDLSNPVAPPVEANHQRDHFVCFQVKAQKKRASGETLPKFPKGIQVEVADQFQTRRYDLTTPRKLCLPTDKAGTPSFLKGPAKGQPVSLAPASIRHPEEHLLCYTAKLASTRIDQLGCGPLVAGAKGPKITPKQPKHRPQPGIFVANQLGTLQLDSTKELELCVPSLVEFPDM